MAVPDRPLPLRPIIIRTRTRKRIEARIHHPELVVRLSRCVGRGTVSLLRNRPRDGAFVNGARLWWCISLRLTVRSYNAAAGISYITIMILI